MDQNDEVPPKDYLDSESDICNKIVTYIVVIFRV